MSTWQAAAASSPVLERLKKQGYEVIFALDQIDEIALQNVGKFDDVDVVDASKENADLGEVSEEEKSANEEAKKEFEDTCKYIKEKLGTKVGTNNNMHRNHNHRRKSQRRRRQQQQ